MASIIEKYLNVFINKYFKKINNCYFNAKLILIYDNTSYDMSL